MSKTMPWKWIFFSWHCFTHFPKTTAPPHIIFSGKRSTIIIFELCKFSVNLWTLCFLSYKKYIHLIGLKELHRIGKSKNREDHRFTRYSDDDSRKRPLKYFCLKFHIWWEINNVISRLEFIAQWALNSFLFWHLCNAKFVIGSWPRWPIDLKLLQVCQFLYMVGYI